ncbi:OstA-like protein [Mucilaginibacter terrae]|uniref:Lipopolysaccharide export system protein LptA n=1 Tax=Mucilaginibacter terrae TaxID=1955052 RepID=A0ABU3GXP5_9SPHI|nr:OstA-like protein [Mucilaginibacter terrae]MDT3404196.1 lipopolysaccharide export system protein LptA [Mucilaginibacter terrae]
MRKYLFTYILLIVAVAAMAQRKPKTTIVKILSSTSSVGVKINGEDVLKVYKGVFQQESTTLRSDSAYFYQKRNSFDAFGNVNINQGDTLNVYGDKLYYNGNTHVALVTDNVRMVDRDATLTTNYLTYNTATKIGTYTGGGKLVNKDNTLVSQNGYYFSGSRDAYFRYNVVLTTVDAIIKTDTLRYNSGTRISYFYGPTHIYGKDKDTLYTEKGEYHTITEQAFFSKNNQYTQTSKSLKGDSLFYDRLKGYGRAVRNVTFNDNEQKVTIKGHLGTYYRAEDRAVVTQNPYVIMVTEDKDTTKADTVIDAAPIIAKKDKTAVAKKTPPVVKGKPATNKATDETTAVTDSTTVKPAPKIKRDTIYWGADTLETRIVTYKVLRELQEKMRQAGIKDTSLKDKSQTVKKIPLKLSTTKNLIAMPPAGIKMDTSFFKSEYFGKPKKTVVDSAKLKKALADSLPKKAKMIKDISAKKLTTTPKVVKLDSVYLQRKFDLKDTARIRILTAHHNSKIFKSDLQAKADSMFYSYADSTMRMFVAPILWTQGSQISGDTIYFQLKNKKLDNMDVWPSALTVNIEGTDSTYFNQVAGKKIRGYFVSNKLQRMFVDGNAETIYFNRDSTKKVTEMMRSVSSRIRVNFKDNKAENVTLYTKVGQDIYPVDKTKDDDKILKGFLWKPKERPANKEAITSPVRVKKITPAKKPATKAPPGKGKVTPAIGKKTAPADSSQGKPLKPDSAALNGRPMRPDSAGSESVADTVIKAKTAPAKPLVPPADSTKRKLVRDTTAAIKKPKEQE